MGIRGITRSLVQAMLAPTPPKSDTTVSVVITTVRERVMNANLLAARLARRGIDAEVLMDPHRAGVWPTSSLAWSMLAQSKSDWGLVLQDDLTACRHFGSWIKHVLEHAPGNVVNLFTWGREHELTPAREQGYDWVQYRIRCYGPAIAIRTEYIQNMLHWCRSRIDESFESYDQRVGLWAYTIDSPICVPTRHLVQHSPGPSAHTDQPGSARYSSHYAPVLITPFTSSTLRDYPDWDEAAKGWDALKLTGSLR